jgi:hypothetical protein
MIGQAIKKAHIRVERLRRIVDRASDGLRCDEEAACRRNIAATLRRRLASDLMVCPSDLGALDAPSADGHARPPAARRELADIGEVLEAAIKFARIERGLSSDLET